MVTFGRDDAKKMTPKIINLLNKEYPDLKKNIIIGKAFHNIEEIKKEIDKNTNLIYYSNAGKMIEIMLDSDIAISACWQTLNELAKVGVPTIGICVVQNQLRNAEGQEKSGFLEYTVLWNNEKLLENIIKLRYIIEDKSQRKKILEIRKDLIDGRGIKRLLTELIHQRL